MKKITKILASMFAFVFVIMGAICLTACGADKQKVGIVGISLDTSGTKVVYFEGESLSTVGLIVNYVYDDGSEKKTQDYTINDTEFVSTAYGEYRIEVNAGAYSKTYTVTVYEKNYESLFYIAMSNMGLIYNYECSAKYNTIVTNEGYYDKSVNHQQWATASGKYKCVPNNSFTATTSAQYDTFEEAYSQVINGVSGIKTPKQLIQYYYRRSLTILGTTQTIKIENYTRGDNVNTINLQFSYSYTDGTASGSTSSELEFQQVDGKLILKRDGNYYFNVEGLELPTIPN